MRGIPVGLRALVRSQAGAVRRGAGEVIGAGASGEGRRGGRGTGRGAEGGRTVPGGMDLD